MLLAASAGAVARRQCSRAAMPLALIESAADALSNDLRNVDKLMLVADNNDLRNLEKKDVLPPWCGYARE